MQKNIKDEWTKEFPTEKGEYWFYGHANKYSIYQQDKEWYYIKIRKDSLGNIMYITEGSFIQESFMQGIFTKVKFPDIPEELK